MTLNLREIKTGIRAYIRSSFIEDVVEQSVPDPKTVLRLPDGKVKPYIAFQFGDIQRLYAGSRGLTGVRNDDYELPIRFQALSGDAEIASDIADEIMDVMLGYTSEQTGEVRKRPGGGMFSITSTNGATECYAFPASYAVTIQMLEK